MSQTDNAAQDYSGMKLPELRALAAERGMKGISTLRKGELQEALRTGRVPERDKRRATLKANENATERVAAPRPTESAAHTTAEATNAQATAGENSQDSRGGRQLEGRTRSQARRGRGRPRRDQEGFAQSADSSAGDSAQSAAGSAGQPGQGEQEDNREGREVRGANSANRSRRGRPPLRQDSRQDNREESGADNRRFGDDEEDGNSRRGRRGRRNNRRNQQREAQGGNYQNANQGNNAGGRDNQVREGDDLQQVAGILDVVDNNVAFLRTTGYRPGTSDVFVNGNLVRRLGLRPGDALVGKVKAGGANYTHGNGRNRRRYNQLLHVDSVNGLTPAEARDRPAFSKLTPLYPNQRLRLETEQKNLTTRVIDLVMPIGKGQRALIVSPPKAGKTTILQNIANAIATNNPECYLMVVLVDERPEEVTDMQRSVRGEVISSTFDRPPSEHTRVAELAIERAKRLVEQGEDVVVLLDSITRLGRAYNNSSPASGRILSGGVDSNALYPPKRFLGAARNIENGGSLTIIATAMVETGSTGDTVIFEEFKGTGNAELKLDRGISERRIFPAVDVNPSGTRKDELLMVAEEARIMTKLRRILSGLDSYSAIELLLKQLKKTRSNGEFLMQIASSAPMAATGNEEDYS
ncbi:transcription termination factor Rho [Corynebacterium lizhenjunii]|uniref:Transcription termination factor Rho n=1 Tax=Corynebacterium lizhenjunii TaxID=2709394 RepID=A0A7T0PAL0_9CORY|nr:transcription termination factor Rho [Corynebacterium lizhenjunii]QPK79993.1 transcription termination factor Rho [Corynebacterium lizhenjunii]